MCGFVAIIGPGAMVPRAILEQMRDRLIHRGPDGEGLWQKGYERGSVSFGFRRLAIIDTRHVADQPMVLGDGRKVIVFNGEIYNFVELRAELEAAGRVFRTRSDTEVLLQGYEHWGEAVVERLNGMFAFAIWDEATSQVFIARDRFGEKPLFMCRLPDGKVAFASEIKALLAHPEADASYDLEMFGSVLGGHVLFGTDETLFRQVRQFRAAHCMTLAVSGEIIRERRYWTPNYDRSLADIDLDELTHRLRDHLERSVTMRMRSDVPVTACLSGGLDSSSLVALLAGRRQEEVGRIRSTISVRFPDDPTIDEGRFIDMVLQRTGLEGHTVTPTAEDMVRDLRQLHWHHETIIPGPSMYLEWSLMRQARALGYKVIIDGQGADEILAGYACYLKAYQAELASGGPLGFLKAIHIGRMRDQRLRRAATLYSDSSRRFSNKDSLDLLQLLRYQKRWLPTRVKEYGNDGLPLPSEIGALRFDLALNLLRTSLPSNLFSGDRNSMAHGIECRYPFLDYELVEFASRLPDAAFLEKAWGKSLLRKAMSDRLPNDIAWRPDKVGFAAPQDKWLATPKASEWLHERIFDRGLSGLPGYRFEDAMRCWLQHQAGIADHSTKLWQLASAAELLEMGRTNEWSPLSIQPDTEVRPLAPVLDQQTCELLDDGRIFREGTCAGDRTVWIISYTPVSKEPRVLRQARALEEAGWRIVVLGLPGKTPCPKSWHFVEIPDASPLVSPRALAKAVVFMGLRALGGLTARYGRGDFLKMSGARIVQAFTPSYRVRERAIVTFLERHPDYRPDLVLCHDYFTADVAVNVARIANAKVSVDCHEYALGQYAHDPYWVKRHQSVVRALQDDLYARVDGITTVCQGIAELIEKDHAVLRPVRVVRSVPFYVPQPFRPTGDVVTVLYHGEIFPSRALHVAVRSMRLWRPEFRLILRGYSDPAYVAQLRQIAVEVGVADRLELQPPVPFDQIVPAANEADVGYFVHIDTSPQRRFALPNKFFEYVLAGLALVVSDLPEMARLVREHDLGVLVPECEEESIARVINSLDRESIDEMKRHSLAAAKELNWDAEKERMMSLYREILE